MVAIETLWRVTTEIKKETRVVTLFYAILLPSEYSTVVPNNDYLKNSSGSLSDFNKKLIPKISEVQEQRPFLGEELYRLYFIFQAFAFRQAIKILSRKDKNTIYEWDKDFDGEKDISMYQTLKEIFTEEELENIIKISKPFAPVHDILDAIELKIVAEANEWIFGRQLVTMSIEEQQRISKLLQPPQSID